MATDTSTARAHVRPGRQRGTALVCAATAGLVTLVGCGRAERVMNGSATDGQTMTHDATASTLFPPPSPADAPIDGATGTALREAVPGLYVPDAVDARTLTSGAVSVHRSGPCSGLRDVLLAGDWAFAGELVVPPDAGSLLASAGLSPQILLRQGDDRAFALLSDGSDGCDATIGRAASGVVALQAGAMGATGPGWSVVSTCIDIAGSITLSAVVGLSDGSLSALVHGVLDPPAAGAPPDAERTVSSGDSGDTVLTSAPSGVLGVFSALLAASAAGGSGEAPAGFDPTTFVTLDAVDDQIGVATVDAADGHARGTMQLTGLVSGADDGGGTPAYMSFPFDCPTVVEFAG